MRNGALGSQPWKSLGSNGLDELELNLLNPGQKTYFDFMEALCKKRGRQIHEKRAFAIVAWPSPQGVKKCSNVRTSWYGCCCNDTMRTQNPVGPVSLSTFRETQGVLKYHRPYLCELLVEAGDPIPVNFFFEHFFLSLK
ncbi:hypothetical protein GQ600_20175 [Phytophthora cactorum]|nr:hypothetical protein GQ600_20175 [Phytophthora cactorum]